MIEKGTDVDSVQSFFRVVKFLSIHGLYGFGHLFYADEFAVLLVLPVPLIFDFFGTHAFMVGCTCDGVNIGVCGWLLVMNIVWSAVPRRKG